MVKLSDPIPISPKQIAEISKLFPGETVELRLIEENDSIPGAIHVDSSNSRSMFIDRQGGTIGISRQALESLEDHEPTN